MFVAKIKKNIPVSYGRTNEYPELTVNPSDEELNLKGFKKIGKKSFDKLTQTLVYSEPYIEGDYVYTVTVQNLTDEEIQMHKTAMFDSIKIQAFRKLQEEKYYNLDGDASKWTRQKKDALGDNVDIIEKPKKFSEKKYTYEGQTVLSTINVIDEIKSEWDNLSTEKQTKWNNYFSQLENIYQNGIDENLDPRTWNEWPERPVTVTPL